MDKYNIEFDYFHDYESEQFAFYRIPKALFTDDYFRNLSSDAKVLYGLMLDRMGLSLKNNWVDEQGRVYIIFTLEQVMQYMNCGKDKGVKIMAELDCSEKGIGLIQRVKRGMGKPAIIYVKSFIIREKVKENAVNSMVDECQNQEFGETEVKSSEKPKSRLLENRSQELEDAEVKSSEKPKSRLLENRSQEFGKTEVKSSEKSESGLLENRSQDFGKTDPNNTNYNNTDFNDTDRSDINLINLSGVPQKRQTDRIDRMTVIHTYTDVIKANIEYDLLIQGIGAVDKEYVDEIVELMVEVVSIPRDSIMISTTEYPYPLVRERLLKIGYEHIQYVLERLHENTTKVWNIKAYLLTCLFNATTTINNYYRSAANYDLYGGGNYV